MEKGEVTYGVLRVVFYDATPFRLHPQGTLVYKMWVPRIGAKVGYATLNSFLLGA